jgi:hypothetical protein
LGVGPGFSPGQRSGLVREVVAIRFSAPRRRERRTPGHRGIPAAIPHPPGLGRDQHGRQADQFQHRLSQFSTVFTVAWLRPGEEGRYQFRG